MTAPRFAIAAKRKPADPAPYVPGNFQTQITALGLRATCYLNVSVICDDGANLWLPRDLIGDDGKTLIIYRPADSSYSIDGWEPWHDGMFGGRRDRIGNVLAWVARAKAVRAGTASNFRGV